MICKCAEGQSLLDIPFKVSMMMLQQNVSFDQLSDHIYMAAVSSASV